jgi:hypothetical protein
MQLVHQQRDQLCHDPERIVARPKRMLPFCKMLRAVVCMPKVCGFCTQHIEVYLILVCALPCGAQVQFSFKFSYKFSYNVLDIWCAQEWWKSAGPPMLRFFGVVGNQYG